VAGLASRLPALAQAHFELLEDLDELVGLVALGAGEAEQLPRPLDDGAAPRRKCLAQCLVPPGFDA
jgi:hypothetical protein